MRNSTHQAKGRLRPFPLRLAALGLLLPLGACSVDKLLEVNDPDVLGAGGLSDPQNLPAVYAAAVAEFTHAYSGGGDTGGGGGNEGQILLSGLLSDELRTHDTFNTRIQIDMRRIIATSTNGTSANGQLEDAERNLHRARSFADQGAALFAAGGLATDPRRSELLSLAAYTYVFFGENYCSGVTFSNVPLTGGDATFGTPQNTQQIFTAAIARFDSALAVSTAGSDERYLAQVGKGRALLDRGGPGDLAAAAAAVAGVPTGWEYDVLHSANTSRQQNGVWEYTDDSGRYGVSDQEGTISVGLPFGSQGDIEGSVKDPRIPSDSELQVSFDPSIPEPFYAQLKYPDRASPVPLANGIEARLIEAEAALANGTSNAYLVQVNALRARVGLAPLTDPGTRDARIRQFFQERAYWLFLTSHRLGDLRRLIRQYGYTQGQVFPTGDYYRGGTYGTDVNLPIFVDENNNPNFTGCINRNA
ncbi:MAG: RagB/SusD family nutrient uptake outer membrane protein [Gemmatimonadetes bacterium]|nr:RagB/SusD family nutrient uptake outer membrane protein [Gemmatimonadota bacterium]